MTSKLEVFCCACMAVCSVSYRFYSIARLAPDEALLAAFTWASWDLQTASAAPTQYINLRTATIFFFLLFNQR